MIFLTLPRDKSNPLEPVENAAAGDDDSIVIDLEGALLKSPSWFQYFMLVAIEAGSPLRALLLFFILPFAWITGCLVHPALELQILCFVAVAGLRASAVESVGRAVLAKFFLEDLNPETFRVFKACGKRMVVTSLPALMVEPLASHYLDASAIGSKLGITSKGYCTGLINMVVCSENKAQLAQKHFGGDRAPISIGIGSGSGTDFLGVCKKCLDARSNPSPPCATVPKKDYIKPLVFHDGRLIKSPTPLHCLAIGLWIPLALPLAIIRVVVGLALPSRLALPAEALLGISIRVAGCIPPGAAGSTDETEPTRRTAHRGVLFVCTHRSLLDPVFISYARMRHVKTVTYSVSPVSEVLSPIRTARLTRCREHDARTMARLLDTGDLAVCPEGTTCREPFLLRFSALFAELTDRIVPVGVTSSLTMFHATTARGWKALDPLFFFMNPRPGYEVRFLAPLAAEETCVGGGRPSHEVANRVQRMLAESLGYQCTNLTRRDKYRMLVGNDGIVGGGGPCPFRK
ncbi:hypothetical protein SELMODRAFT_405007 [Selaginella moellendorffii]|uniref:Uncharacterized protein GPAT6-1 n=1 Tax=Selaginella moellendorffii TaxID=88036 RepID=D8QY34_SELML|nr:glycerol-3-phosphate acyltransferase 5 [Selaginella moellendorffii]EFJ35133.1 hypothetical protein SELMODRAFT_405007 [Selaginella moellendorffii]|eukprot:XP_002963262.1 glycerol-3-phosphate acyltransferase 5 [Selaginella moellendorffii]